MFDRRLDVWQKVGVVGCLTEGWMFGRRPGCWVFDRRLGMFDRRLGV